MPGIYRVFQESQLPVEGSTWFFNVPLTDEKGQPVQLHRLAEVTLTLRSLEEVPEQLILVNVDVMGDRSHGSIDTQGNYGLTLKPSELSIFVRERDLPWNPKRRATVRYTYDRDKVQNKMIEFSIHRL